ncbi:MAG: crotonase/enoyl-CoA hydratase family protein [Bradymonadia bacterium]
MSQLVNYACEHKIARITLDDGKVNALSPQMIAEINSALDQAEADGAVVVLTGRPGIFSAGFDLKILKQGNAQTLGMLQAGFELAARLLEHRTPVLIACPGHAMAMGAFLTLSADYRIGISGDFNYQANEVAIGLTMPRAAIAICRQRLTAAHFERAVVLAEAFDPEGALKAGFLDQVVAPEALFDAAMARAAQLTSLDMRAHAETKRRAREATLQAIRQGNEADIREHTQRGM